MSTGTGTGDPEAFLERFAAVKRRVSALAAQVYARAGLGALQAKLLRRIGNAKQISQAELARATDSDVALVGRAVQTLISRSVVKRARSAEDRREWVVSLTPTGRRLYARVTRLREQLAARVVGALDARDLENFERIATKILAATDEDAPR
jgi:DNA-binding MarR family transcriptional regulator